MDLGQVSEYCYNLTNSYLEIKNQTQVIADTQDAIRLTKRYFLQDIFPRWSPLSCEISFSYNGGKDCQVLLLLYLGCIWEFFLNSVQDSQYDRQYHQYPLRSLPTVFIDQEETFATMEDFVASTSERYCLSLYESVRDEGKKLSMPEAFDQYLKLHSDTKAIVIGIRYTDPYAADLKTIQPTDDDWPDFLRLQPLLHWKLSNIWSFLLFSNEPICGIYGMGFTSIGSIKNTLPNPHLNVDRKDKPSLLFQWEIAHAFGKTDDQDPEVNVSQVNHKDLALLNNSNEKYLPGWYLTDDSLERAGRVKRC
ncbi:hypothetical protein HG537_0D03070 [Torulaspora globosa]|uniref:FAD synthase n=1 Tax=Torulaspora globosa TaxID=48254 RepID=A0A7H9HT67_9SACH|nr:hypothetical protein HG537_0D03070 [Torulaspora sp. CBS 2947]